MKKAVSLVLTALALTLSGAASAGPICDSYIAERQAGLPSNPARVSACLSELYAEKAYIRSTTPPALLSSALAAYNQRVQTIMRNMR